MTRNEELAAAFEAAAAGAMAQFSYNKGPFSAASFDAAKLQEATLRAIAGVYRNLAEKEKLPPSDNVGGFTVMPYDWRYASRGLAISTVIAEARDRK